MSLPSSIEKLLNERHITYRLIPHMPDYSAQRTAAHTHTRGDHFAKVVVLTVDGRHAIFVLPAHHKIDWGKMHEAMQGREVKLAPEQDLRLLFPDCELGAEPPLGNLYNLPVYISARMNRDAEIVFNAGTHTDVVSMAFGDFERLVNARMLDFSIPESMNSIH